MNYEQVRKIEVLFFPIFLFFHFFFGNMEKSNEQEFCLSIEVLNDFRFKLAKKSFFFGIINYFVSICHYCPPAEQISAGNQSHSKKVRNLNFLASDKKAILCHMIIKLSYHTHRE